MKALTLAIGFLFSIADTCTAQTPQATAVTSAAFLSSPVPDGLATVFGSGLSDKTYTASSLPLPTQLGPTSISICPANSTSKAFACATAQLVFVSPAQVNFYIPPIQDANGGPFDFGNNYPVVYSVTVGSQSTQISGLLSAEAPSIFPIGFDCNFDPNYGDTSPCGLSPAQLGAQQVQRGAIVDLQGNPVTSLNPARPGQFYSVYLTGLYLAAGQPAALAATTGVSLSAIPTPQDSVDGSGSAALAPTYAGPSSFAGLQQVNFQLDPSLFGDTASGVLFQCGDYRFELPIGFSVGTGAADQHNDSLPVLVKNGDVPCTP